MKREGRQHGTVRTNRILPPPWNPRPGSRFVNRFDSPPTGGLFTKEPSRPTKEPSRSKFTGKCGGPRWAECHLYPACKSKDKTKGTNKVKSREVASSHRLITWRVIDGRPGLNFSGMSASGLAEHLETAYINDYDDRDDEEEEEGDDNIGYERESEGKTDENDGLATPILKQAAAENDDDDDNARSFCDVGFVWNQVEEDEDGWCVVVGDIDSL